jgi:ppGpp synthetase/RelA/SpoT-type nucleotidyltranferase
MGRVEARAKTIAGFAEKALRKHAKYDNPLERMTDLAGARIVAYTLDEARAICRFIEHEAKREAGFWIDWDNSLDARKQLKTQEFGYNGMHYVVELRLDEILGVKVPPEIQSIPEKRSYKAEIQVHTVLQNAWSTIGHDRIYKAQIKVPETLRREVHAVAATLESVDQAFAKSVESLDRYIRNFETYREPGELQDDIGMWEAIHAEDPNDRGAIHQLGRRLMAAQRWEEAYQTLKALKDEPRADVQSDLGRSAWRSGRVPDEEARGYLRRVLELSPQDVRTLCTLANTYRNVDVDMAIEYYEKAFSLDPQEPAVLSPFVECHIRRDRSLSRLGLMRGSLVAAFCECHERADRGVYLPQAHFNCGRLHLYLGDFYTAVNSYAMAVSACHLPEMIRDELDALTAILDALADGKGPDDLLESSQLAGFEWVRRLLVVALAAGAATWRARPDEPGAKAWAEAGKSVEQRLRDLATSASQTTEAFPLPVVIVAGGCDPKFEKDLVATYGGLLQEAFEAFSGTIISGGTTAGISGMVGQLKPSPGRQLHRVAYLPSVDPLPRGDKPCGSYEVRPSPGKDYNPAGVLRAWADILLQRVGPGKVRILGIDGGDLTGFELRLGLALGAVVGVAEDSGRVVKTLLEERTPCRPEGLVPLPADAATWAAFIRGASPELDRLTVEQVEPAARCVHEQFREDCQNSAEKHDLSVLPWGPKLPEVYKASSRHQVRFAALICDAVGYDVVPAGPAESLNPESPPIPADFEKKVEAMARLEHGRFCAERLADGWRYGRKKDLAHKLNSTIVPWTSLPPDTRRYDFDAVRNFPKWLAAAGLKIVPRV